MTDARVRPELEELAARCLSLSKAAGPPTRAVSLRRRRVPVFPVSVLAGNEGFFTLALASLFPYATLAFHAKPVAEPDYVFTATT